MTPAFVGLKSQKRADGGRKNRSGYAQEHAAANLDNAEFDENILRVREEEKSIGGVSENLAISGDDAGSIQNELS